MGPGAVKVKPVGVPGEYLVTATLRAHVQVASGSNAASAVSANSTAALPLDLARQLGLLRVETRGGLDVRGQPKREPR